MADFSRPSGGWRFEFGGMNVNDVADALSYHKMPLAINVRATTDKATKTRPGYVQAFNTSGNLPITDVQAYSDLANANATRHLARNSNNQIFLDNGNAVGNLVGGGNGVFMIPFRPSAAVSPWMYVASPGDYQKFSSPGAQPSTVGQVTQYKVGIRENQSAPTVSPRAYSHYDFNGAAGDWANSGTAGALADGSRPADNTVVVFADPASNNERWSVQVGDTLDGYQTQELITIDSGGLNQITVVEDVLPALKNIYALQSIFYYAGNSGRALVVPNQMAGDPSTPTFTDNIPSALPISTISEIVTLRRGAIITINGDKCLVLAIIKGPDGNVSLEVMDYTGSHVAGQVIAGLPAIIVGNITAGSAAKAIAVTHIITTVTNGIGYISRNLATNPFIQNLNPLGTPPQANDYVSLLLNISDITKLTSITVNFDVNNGSADFITNAFYRTFLPADLGFTSGQSSATSPWYTLNFPISTLQKIGGDQTRTLQNCQAIRIQFNVTASTQFELSGLHVGGGGSPDVGLNAPYFYAVVGRDSHTGAFGNPSPITRYGINPRRQPVYVNITDQSSDLQVDYWDVYRFGGTISSWHYIGSIANPVAGGTVTFTDNYFDTSAVAGSELEFDNFEPWPTIDKPFALNSGVSGTGVTTQILCYGGAILIVWSAAANFANPAPSTISRWLPGTLIQLGGQSAYTLMSRPTSVVLANPPNTVYYAYLLETVENCGSGAIASLLVQEPNVANQPVYAVWGPDAQGTVFGLGDALRPGVLYYSKVYNPDSVSDANSLELSPPDEPLLGGEILNGTSYVANTKKWWRLYPNAQTSSYQAVEAPFGHPLAAIYGHCTDEQYIYFWGKDGIYASAGGPAKSLTKEDLFPLFPHESVPGRDCSYNGKTIKAPDYNRVETFRLNVYNGYLFADYQDNLGVYNTLVMGLHGLAKEATPWSYDIYANQITVHKGLSRVANVLMMGATTGQVMQEQDLHNDINTPITGDLAVFEYNGGDERADMYWGDLFIDALPSAGLSCTPVSSGINVNAPTVIAKNNTRQRGQVSVGGEQTLKFMGMRLHWVDDFTTQPEATILYTWQSSFVPKQEVTTDRFTDWDNGGMVGAKYMQGLILEADTNGVNKIIQVRDSDTNTLHTLKPSPINHVTQSEIAYSFDVPFIAHLIRIEPGDLVPWRMYKAKWIFEPTPESAYRWQTQGTSFDIPGYKFIHRIVAAYNAPQPITLNITVQDGIAPVPITLPATGGAYKKVVFNLSPNKGQLYFFEAFSTAPWQPFLNDWEIHIGAWNRQEKMIIYKNIGSEHGATARV